MPKRIIVSLAVFLGCVGCGPVAIALGLQEALKDDPQDLGAPQVAIEIRDGTGDKQPPTATSQRELPFVFKTGKPGVRLTAMVIGPVFWGLEAQTAETARAFREDGVVPESPFIQVGDYTIALRTFTGLKPDTTGNPPLTSYLGGIREGRYELHVRGVDNEGRSDFASHVWVFDETPPTAPGVLRVENDGARQIRLDWTASIDPRPSDQAPGIQAGLSGYRVYFDVGSTKIPDDPRPANPTFFGSAPKGGEVIASPVDLPATATSYTLNGAYAGRMHYFRVVAYDVAGNESDLAAAEEFAVRSRFGGDGTFTSGFGPDFSGIYEKDVDARWVAAARFENENGVDGFAMPGSTPTEILVYLSMWDHEEFPAGGGPVKIDAPDGARSAHAIDWNLDGFPDLLVAGETGFTFFTNEYDAETRRRKFTREPTTSVGRPIENVALFERSLVVPSADADTRRYEQLFAAGGQPQPVIDPLDGNLPYPSLGEVVHDVVLADFDRSGDAECFVAVDSSLILLPRPNGPAFVSGQTLPVGGSPRWIAIGDFLRDGMPDVVVSTQEGDLSVLLARGSNGQWDGTFAPYARIPVGSTAGPLATGDFDNDGILDVAVAGAAPGRVTILLGNGTDRRGDGTFRVAGSMPHHVGAPHALVAADVDGSGIVDLLVSGSNGVEPLLGGGATASITTDGETLTSPFSAPIRIAEAGTQVVSADVNGDGLADLVVAQGNDSVRTYLARPPRRAGESPFFGPQTTRGAADMREIAVGRLLGDTIPDVIGDGAVTYEFPGPDTGAPVLHGLGLDGFGIGVFASGDVRFEQPRQSAASSECPAPDMTADRIPFVLRGGPGWLIASEDEIPGDGLPPLRAVAWAGRLLYGRCAFDGVAVADANFDGREDLLVFHATGRVTVGRDRSDPLKVTVGAPTSVVDDTVDDETTFDCGPSPWRPLVTHFTGGHEVDIAVINAGMKQVTILPGALRNQPGEQLATLFPSMTAEIYAMAYEPTALCVFRDPGDEPRRAPLIVLQGSENRAVWLTRPGQPEVFSLPEASGALTSIATGDFNGDGLIDVAVAGGGVWVFFGGGEVHGE